MEIGESRVRATPVALLGDRVLLVAIALSAVASVILGFQFVDSGLAMGATLALVIVAALTYAGARATVASRFVLTFVLVSLVALHIQLARGMTEFHFGVFVTLDEIRAHLDFLRQAKTVLFCTVADAAEGRAALEFVRRELPLR